MVWIKGGERIGSGTDRRKNRAKIGFSIGRSEGGGARIKFR